MDEDDFRHRLETEQKPLNRYQLLGWHPLPYGGQGRRAAAKKIMLISVAMGIVALVLVLIADWVLSAFD